MMKNSLIILFALLFIACGTPRPQQTYDEMLNDVVENFNVGTVGGDSVLNVFVQKAKADSVARKYSNPAMKEELMLNLISEYLQAGQFDNAQHLYDNMVEYATAEYGENSQMTAMVYFEKAHLYERMGNRDNAIRMMQKSAAVFERLPESSVNHYKDANEYLKMWMETN
ncbi:tetratricopeptide repeat protein [Alistipes putredinis]|uniref:tetratricopeptide repeat protein n=1 Tax=Alistipes putredinis TaxID=28117 RepID=UPI003A88E3BA